MELLTFLNNTITWVKEFTITQWVGVVSLGFLMVSMGFGVKILFAQPIDKSLDGLYQRLTPEFKALIEGNKFLQLNFYKSLCGKFNPNDSFTIIPAEIPFRKTILSEPSNYFSPQISEDKSIITIRFDSKDDRRLNSWFCFKNNAPSTFFDYDHQPLSLTNKKVLWDVITSPHNGSAMFFSTDRFKRSFIKLDFDKMHFVNLSQKQSFIEMWERFFVMNIEKETIEFSLVAWNCARLRDFVIYHKLVPENIKNAATALSEQSSVQDIINWKVYWYGMLDIYPNVFPFVDKHTWASSVTQPEIDGVEFINYKKEILILNSPSLLEGGNIYSSYLFLYSCCFSLAFSFIINIFLFKDYIYIKYIPFK